MVGTKDVDKIHIFGSDDDTLWLAPKGSTLPTGLGALDAAFKDVGFNGESGFDINREDDVYTAKAHQAGKTVKKKITGSSTMLVFRTIEDNVTTIALADNVLSSATALGVTTVSMSASRKIQEFAAVLDVYDGGILYRRIMPNFQVAGGGTETLSKDAITEREFTGEIVGQYTLIFGPIPAP